MTLSIINEAGLSTSNAYVSLASCSEILLMDVHKTDNWASLSTTDQTANIIYGTFLLDVQIDWVGIKTNDSDQALDWPREGVYDQNLDSIDEDTIPVDIQTSCAFYSYFLSQSDRTADNDTFGFKKLKAGSLFMEIDKYDRRPTMPSIVWDILKPYGNKMIGLPRVLERI